jgi:hypothetical protein
MQCDKAAEKEIKLFYVLVTFNFYFIGKSQKDA